MTNIVVDPACDRVAGGEAGVSTISASASTSDLKGDQIMLTPEAPTFKLFWRQTVRREVGTGLYSRLDVRATVIKFKSGHFSAGRRSLLPAVQETGSARWIGTQLMAAYRQNA